MKVLATGIAVLTGLFIIYIGLEYLLAPQAAAAGFGVPTWPQREGTAFLAVKGVRDIATGLVVGALLLSGHRRALGWAMLAFAFIPVGDMVIVLSQGGVARDGARDPRSDRRRRAGRRGPAPARAPDTGERLRTRPRRIRHHLSTRTRPADPLGQRDHVASGAAGHRGGGPVRGARVAVRQWRAFRGLPARR